MHVVYYLISLTVVETFLNVYSVMITLYIHLFIYIYIYIYIYIHMYIIYIKKKELLIISKKSLEKRNRKSMHY